MAGTPHFLKNYLGKNKSLRKVQSACLAILYIYILLTYRELYILYKQKKQRLSLSYRVQPCHENSTIPIWYITK